MSREGETLGIVGESGSGKSVTSLALLGLVPHPGSVTGGEIVFQNRDLRKLDERELRSIRGAQLAMVFQDPMTSLNPFLPVWLQIAEVAQVHLGYSRDRAREHAIQMLEDVGIPDARARASLYPHQFSGGMRQRVMIAMALACDPKLMIADEPTTALDVTIQAQILELLRNLKQRARTAIILITHDLGIRRRERRRRAGDVRRPGDGISSAPANCLRIPRTRTRGRCCDAFRILPLATAQLHQISGQPPDVSSLLGAAMSFCGRAAPKQSTAAARSFRRTIRSATITGLCAG